MPKDERPAADEAPPKASFEQSMARLSKIVETLEKGDLPLEESLRLFEEGVKLTRAAQERLDAAEQRVERLLGVDGQGKARTAPFETTGDEDEEPPF